MSARALFLDRDGTLMYDRGYLSDPAGVELIPGVAGVLSRFRREGWKLFLLSNQSGVGRGVMSLDQMHAVHNRFLELMNEEAVQFEASYLCTHAPEDNCMCRKPSTWFIEKAAREHAIDLAESWMVGDRESDIVCGKNAGCGTILFENPDFIVAGGLADFIATDWRDICVIIGDGRLNRNPPGR